MLDGPLSFPFFPPALEAIPPAGPAVVSPADRTQRPFLEPTTLREAGENRSVRITEKLSDLVNALVRAGAVVRVRGGWDVRPRRHTYERAPGAGDDDRVEAWPFDLWLDTTSQVVYCCLSADRGAAVWVPLGGV